jgi:hypothetical protein
MGYGYGYRYGYRYGYGELCMRRLTNVLGQSVARLEPLVAQPVGREELLKLRLGVGPHRLSAVLRSQSQW